MLKDFSMEAAMGIFGCAVVWLVVNLESENSLFLENPSKGEAGGDSEPPDFQRKTLELLLLP